jgi:Ca-activated chloride channel family protein
MSPLSRRQFLQTSTALAAGLAGTYAFASEPGAPRGPVPPTGLDPVPFTSPDGKVRGWKVVLPGNRPLATPAVVGGTVFVGGGFGSHEFYAFDAASGKKLWQYQTKDDGPTAAVVDDGHVAFNTESCELEILTAQGSPVWKKWLGDPLMSMPALGGSKVFMAYPDSKGDRRHYLAAFELKRGKECWKQPIAGEIITAPVLADGRVYLSTLDGSLYCFRQADGRPVWQVRKNATSSPAVRDGQCYFSRREEVTVKKEGKEVKQQTEQVAARGPGDQDAVKDFAATRHAADYLDYSKRKDGSPLERAQQQHDANVGFDGSKGDSKMEQAHANLGRGTVSGVWSYQGSRPFICEGQLYTAMGDTLLCVDPRTGKVRWKKGVGEPAKEKKPLLDSVLTPPALVNGKVFLGTSFGEVLCLSASSGAILWSARVGEPILFQPAVARGRVHVSTNAGGLYALETGDVRDDGWLMWGGNAAHNGVAG